MCFTYTCKFLITVPIMTAPTITKIAPLNSTSFTVRWMITDINYSYIYAITWANLRTNVTNSTIVPDDADSYIVTGLDGINNYNVTVTAICGMTMSKPVTVYGKNLFL